MCVNRRLRKLHFNKLTTIDNIVITIAIAACDLRFLDSKNSSKKNYKTFCSIDFYNADIRNQIAK